MEFNHAVKFTEDSADGEQPYYDLSNKLQEENSSFIEKDFNTAQKGS